MDPGNRREDCSDTSSVFVLKQEKFWSLFFPLDILSNIFLLLLELLYSLNDITPLPSQWMDTCLSDGQINILQVLIAESYS